jgi:ribosome-associated translation inhibitor RaiA
MEINKTIKEELEARIRRLEDFIEERGLGSSRLTKAKKIQRKINIGIFLGSLVTVAGLTIWAITQDDE